MRMIDHRIASPSVQDSEEAQLRVLQRLRLGRHVAERLGRSLKQSFVAGSPVGVQHAAQFLGNREGHQEMMHAGE